SVPTEQVCEPSRQRAYGKTCAHESCRSQPGPYRPASVAVGCGAGRALRQGYSGLCGGNRRLLSQRSQPVKPGGWSGGGYEPTATKAHPKVHLFFPPFAEQPQPGFPGLDRTGTAYLSLPGDAIPDYSGGTDTDSAHSGS